MPKRSSMRLERHHQADRRAVGIGDHVAARLLAPGLLFDQVQVVGVDLGNDQRHVGVHAEGARVGDHGASGRGKLRLHLAGDVGVERGEDDLRRAIGLGRRNGHARDALGQGSVEAPLGGVAVLLAAGAVAGRKPRDLEPRMVLEQLDEALADHTGRAKDADGIFALHGSKHFSVQEKKLGPRDGKTRDEGTKNGDRGNKGPRERGTKGTKGTRDGEGTRMRQGSKELMRDEQRKRECQRGVFA